MRNLILAAVLLGLATAAYGQPQANASPSEVYLDYHETLKSSFNDDKIWPYYVERVRKRYQQRFSSDVRSKAFFIMKSAAPSKVEVVEETVEGDTATLKLRPTSGERLLGTATLKRERTGWRIENVVWQQR